MENSQSQLRRAGKSALNKNVNTAMRKTRKTKQRRKISLREWKIWIDTGVLPPFSPVNATSSGRNERVKVNEQQSNLVTTSVKNKIRLVNVKSGKERSRKRNDARVTTNMVRGAHQLEERTTTAEEAMDIHQGHDQTGKNMLATVNLTSKAPTSRSESMRKIKKEPTEVSNTLAETRQISRRKQRVPTRPYSGRDHIGDAASSLPPSVDPPIKQEDEDVIPLEIQSPLPDENSAEHLNEGTNKLRLDTELPSSIEPVAPSASAIKSPIANPSSPNSLQRRRKQSNQQNQVQVAPPYGPFHFAQSHLNVVYWKPPRLDTVPKTYLEVHSYVNPVAVALVSITRTFDHYQYPRAFANFCKDSIYTNTDITSIATTVVRCAISLYHHGTTNLFFKNPENHPHGVDAKLSFLERITAFMKLVREFKNAADQIMCGRHCIEYLASPNANWNALNEHLWEWHRARTAEHSHTSMARGIAAQNERRIEQARRTEQVERNAQGGDVSGGWDDAIIISE